METFERTIVLSSGEGVTVAGRAITAWSGQIVREIASAGYKADGSPLNVEELADANEILKRGKAA